MVVDDDSTSRRILENILNKIGECTAVDSGSKALTLLNMAINDKAPFELLILDVSMPDMDGTEVLLNIRKDEHQRGIPKSKRLKVIMLTASMRMSTVKTCIKWGCNGFVSKPFSPQTLFQNMERLGFDIPADVKRTDENAKKVTLLVGQIIRRFNKGDVTLPILPHMVKKIQTLLNSPSCAIKDLAEIIEKDAVITARLVSIANSSLFKGLDTITNLNGALLRLGLKETHSLISTLTSKNLFSSKNKTLNRLMNKLWMHSLACALCARSIAEELSLANPEDLFLMGIMHDIGKVLLLSAVADISPDQSFDDHHLQRAIEDVHTTFGAILVKKWGFSKKHIWTTELHHWHTFPDDTEVELLVVHLANALARDIGFDSSFASPPSPDEIKTDLASIESVKLLKIKEKQINNVRQKASETIQELTHEF